MMYHETVKTSEDEIIIEDDSVHSSKLGAGIARVIRIDSDERHKKSLNFIVKIRYKDSNPEYDVIEYNYKTRIEMQNKLKELEYLLSEIKNHPDMSTPIFAFNYLIKPSEVASVYATLIISEERKYIEKGLTKDEIDILESSDIEWFPENITESTYDIRVFSEDEYEKVLQLLGRK